MNSIAQKIVDLHLERPKMTGPEIAAALGISKPYVRAVSYRRGICFPSAIKPNLIRVLVEALEMVRDADEDCHRDGLQTIPAPARAKIDAVLKRARGGPA